MGLIDSHAHLTDPSLAEQIEAVVARATEAGVERIVTVGVSAADSEASLQMAERFPEQVRATVGIHPHEARSATEEDFERLAQWVQHPLVVAVGEIGLDYHYDYSPRSMQRAGFARQLELAATHDYPVVIHSREALDDTVRILIGNEMADRSVVFHCFGGTEEQADLLRQHGWWTSFTGTVTFPKANALHQVARTCPAERLMIETDCPYLSPVPLRGKRPNEPAYLVHTARFLAELRGEEYETFVASRSANTKRFFRM